MTNTKSKKVDFLLTDLFSTKKDDVLAALDKIPSQGNARVVIPLLRTYKAWEDDGMIRGGIEKILRELKTETAIPELITALEDPEYDEERALIISSFWNAGLFPVDDVDVLVRHAIRGNYMVALEVITVIENIESEIEEQVLQDAIFDIDEFMDEYPTAEHGELLSQLKDVLTTLYNR
ncbi:MAG: hypothetical protein LC664_05620 [Flavobacteriales bacterium]|nr:hypothetical protein [Flavobacteriales bacterium]